MKKSAVLAALAGLAMVATAANAQCTSYTATSIAYPGIATGGVDIGNHADDLVTNISLPFAVNFYGVDYTSANVSSNGNLQFLTNGNAWTNTTLPTATFAGPCIFPHWDDLHTGGTGEGIDTLLSGTPGSQTFQIHWFTHFFTGTGQLSFAITFYEGQNYFDVIYENITNSGSSATAGVQSGSAGPSTLFSFNAANLVSGTAIRYGCPVSQPPIISLALNPASGPVGSVFSAFGTVTAGTGPASTSYTVSLNASNVDGGTVVMHNDGVSPDVDGSDNIWSGSVTVGALAANGLQSLTATVTDDLNRSGQSSASYTVIPPPPVNDECSGALPAVNGSNAYDTTQSTTSTGNGAACSVGTDVWFKYTATCSGDVTVSTCGHTTVDTGIAIYASCADAASIACNDDFCGLQSSVTFTATNNTDYYIRIGDFGGGNPHAGIFDITPANGGNPGVANAASDTTCADIGGTVTITANVTAANCPAPDPIASVVADCSALDAGASVAMTDLGGGLYSASVIVGPGATGGTVTVTATSVGALTGSGTTAAVNVNGADAEGDLPATAVVMAGDGSPLASVSGVISANCGGNDADMFQIVICDPANFSASAVGGATFDTQLFLFDANGMGIAFNDDSVGLQSALTSALTASLPAGTYYLAISPYSKDPIDEAGAELWLDTPFASERAPDGLGAANPVASWNADNFNTGGPYTLALTGVCTVAPTGCDPDLNQDGNADQDDVAYLINVIGGGDNPTGIDPDFNHDGNADQDDVAALINAIGGGGCP